MISVGFAADVVIWKSDFFFFWYQKHYLYIKMTKREKVQSSPDPFFLIPYYNLGIAKGFRVKHNYF